jgi:dynein heavy chain
VLVKDIYNPNITKTMRIDEFKQIQASSISQTSYYLRETWINKVKEIIKNNFQETSTTGKSWFNLNETSKETYEMGKLKKFLTLIKFLMQDTLLYMTQKSVQRFVDSLLTFLPLSVDVKDSWNVHNTFFPKVEDSKKQDEQPKNPIPLFSIDLMLSEENEPMYSTSPSDVVVTLMLIFDNGLKALQEISQPEQKLLPHLFKTNIKMFLKSTVRPD